MFLKFQPPVECWTGCSCESLSKNPWLSTQYRFIWNYVHKMLTNSEDCLFTRFLKLLKISQAFLIRPFLTNRYWVIYLVRDINSPIPNFFYRNIYLLIVSSGLKSSNLFSILRGLQNAFHSIIKINITPNFVTKKFVFWWK